MSKELPTKLVLVNSFVQKKTERFEKVICPAFQKVCNESNSYKFIEALNMFKQMVCMSLLAVGKEFGVDLVLIYSPQSEDPIVCDTNNVEKSSTEYLIGLSEAEAALIDLINSYSPNLIKDTEL